MNNENIKNARNVTFKYPVQDKADKLKIFQDLNSQIRGFYFTQSLISEIEKENHSEKHCVYFLFGQEDEIYIGQSENGIGRVKNHVKNKKFWTHCIMFVSDNGTFDKTMIDYLENYFINSFNNSTYIIKNEIIKQKTTHTNEFETVRYYNSAKQIEFLLLCNGVSIESTVNEDKKEERVYFKDKNNRARLYVEDGKFILASNSKLQTKEYFMEKKNKTDGKYSKIIYERFEKTIIQLVQSKKVNKVENYLLTNQDISFNKPSQVASLVSGSIVGGWGFWQGLEKCREAEEEKDI